MKKYILSIFALSIILFIIGCASMPPAPLDKESCAVTMNVGVSLNMGIVPWEWFRTEKIFFIKLEEDNSIMRKEILETNLFRRHWFPVNYQRIYLINIPPGRYAAIGAYGSLVGQFKNNERRGALVLFPESMIKSTIIDIKPGHFVYMGEYKLENAHLFGTMDKADDIQKYYSRLFNTTLSDYVNWRMSLLFNYLEIIATPLKEKKDDKTFKIIFLKSQIDEFKKTEWVERIQNEINDLEK